MTNEACFQPIHGISLERYAHLGAAIADANDDQAKIAEIIQAEGVALADWDAAKHGWTARMQDMSLMGRVATAFMPLYQAALAKKRGGRAMAIPSNTLPSAGQHMPSGVGPGANVFVIHPSNQQRYQARVLSTMPQQTLVQFPNGAQQWVPAAAVKVA